MLSFQSVCVDLSCKLWWYQVVAATAAKSLQSFPTLCDPIDGSPPGSPVPGILQASTLERVAISFSNAWKWKVKVKSLSRVWLSATPRTAAYQAPPPMGFFQARVLEWVAIAFSGTRLLVIIIIHSGERSFKMFWVSSQFSVQFSSSVVPDSLWPYGLQHTRLPCPSPTPGACSNSYPSN